MEKLLLARQKIREFYASYSIYIDVILKFGFVLLTLSLINSKMGYSSILCKWNVVVIIALIASLFSWSGISCTVVVFLAVHMFSLSMESGIFLVGFAFIAAILHYLFLPGYSILIIMVPLAFYFKVPYLIPVVAGLVGRATSFIPVGVGAFSYFFILGIESNASALSEGTLQVIDMIERSTKLLSLILENKMMITTVLVFVLTTLAVYAVRKLSIEYGVYIAVAAGILINIASFLIFGTILEAAVDYKEYFIGLGISSVPIVIISFLLLAVDYSRTEYLQYEDDDYLYYVKAVPKVKLTKRELKKHEIAEVEEAVPEEEDTEITEAIKILDEIADSEMREAENEGQ